MKTALLCVFLCLCLLSGCAGILGPSAPAPVVVAPAPLPAGWAYSLTIDFSETAAATAVAGKGQLLDDNTADTAQIGLAGFFRKVPIIGWIVGGKMIAREAAKFGGAGKGNGPVTEAVLIAAIQSGRAKTIKWTPVKAEEPVAEKK